MAARVLARGARTEAELTLRLTTMGYSAGTVAATVGRCRELGYVNDAVVATDRARALRARGAGSLRIVAELEARGVPELLIAAAVETSLDGADEDAWAERALARQRLDLDTPEDRARAWRLLGARGFPEDVVVRILGE